MTTETFDSTTTDTTAEAEGSETTPEQKPSQTVDPIALARKRQAGAESARQEAEKQRDAALKELETFRAQNRSAEDQKTATEATLKERLAAAEARAAEAEAKAEARILDVKYPNARAELPEVTDEVRLAKFEALLRDDPEAGEPPAPQNPNESNRVASGDPTTKAKEETSDDILARLKAMGKPDWF